MIPSNAAQAIAAIQDGVLGLITEAKIGDIVLGALTSLDNPSSLQITQKPVEDGSLMTDMAIDDPVSISLGILLTNPQFSAEAGAQALLTGNPGLFTDTWRDKRDQLYQYYNDREIITVQTHENVYDSMLTQSIDPLWDVEENYDAFFAIVTFQKIVTFSSKISGGSSKIASAKESVGGL